MTENKIDRYFTKDVDIFTVPGYYALKQYVRKDVFSIPTTDGKHVFVPDRGGKLS
jgi:hypothetical protein